MKKFPLFKGVKNVNSTSLVIKILKKIGSNVGCYCVNQELLTQHILGPPVTNFKQLQVRNKGSTRAGARARVRARG